MLLRKEGEALEHDWQLNGEVTLPEGGVTYRRWSKDRFDPLTQLEHNEDRYEVLKEGVVISSEHHVRSPATRQYTQHQALDLYTQAGFVDPRLYKGFTHEQASTEDPIFTLSGVRP